MFESKQSINEPGFFSNLLENVHRVSSFDRPIVLFNDTHGTGAQFFREVLPLINRALAGTERPIFIVGLFIGQKAQERFAELPNNFYVIPDSQAPSIFSPNFAFNESDIGNIKAIGSRVYPRHPLGYGNCGLLIAYYYQCPNNSLPLIWADGENNSGIPWNPLFCYKPKRHLSVNATVPVAATTLSDRLERAPRATRAPWIFTLAPRLTPGDSLLHDDLKAVCDVLTVGGICIMPSDTCYTLAALPHYSSTIVAARSLFPGRRREPISLSFGSPEMLNRFVRMSTLNRRILFRFTPGPITLVGPLRGTKAKRKLQEVIDPTAGTLGVRIPDSNVERQVSLALNAPLTAYAIRVEGRLAQQYADAYDYIDETLRSLGGNLLVIGIRGSKVCYQQHSTVVETIPEGMSGEILHILRQGEIDRSKIEEVIRIVKGSLFRVRREQEVDDGRQPRKDVHQGEECKG